MKKKKILFHINSMGKGGAERVVSVLTRYFAQDEYDVTLVTLWRAKEEYELSEKVKRINLEELCQGKSLGRLGMAAYRLMTFKKILKEEAPDIVISFCGKANFRCSYSMIGMKTPLLVSVRNDPKRDYVPHKLSTRVMEKKAAGCVFQTPDAQAGFGVELQKKSRVIWNPVEEKYLERQEKRENSGYVVTVGRLSEQKNHMLLLRAFKQVHVAFPELVLRIYGEESEAGMKDKLLQYVKEQGLETSVQFMGQSNQPEKDIRDAGMFVLSSDYEGMPNALIEAMVMGIPVISTDCPCGGPAELIENGVSGILIPVRDEEELAASIRLLLENKELAETLGKKAAELAKKVSPERIYEEWKSYVEELTKY